MKKSYSVEYLRDEIARIIAPSLEMRRSSQLVNDETDVPDLDSPATELEIDEFIVQCPLENRDHINSLLKSVIYPNTIELSDDEIKQFLQSVERWSKVATWYAADDWPVITETGEMLFSKQFALLRRIRYDREELVLPETRLEIGYLSPSFRILEKILAGGINLDKIHWRELEELVAELLEKDGYFVELGSGQSDGGADIIATKDLGEVGFFKSIWQAKKKHRNKVGIAVIRELADTCNEHKANKGIIVTTSYLTSGALARVKRDEYILGKVDRDDLLKWIERVLRGRC